MKPSTNSTNKYWAVICAAGIGSRMASDVPKQYLQLHGRTILEHSLTCFVTHPKIEQIIVTLHPADRWWSNLKLPEQKTILTSQGGAERCLSVLNALNAIKAQAKPQDWVLVHDAVRPCVTQQEIDRLIDTLQHDAVGGILAVPVRDTLKQVNADAQIIKTLPRAQIWQALTPQMFRFAKLYHALERVIAQGEMVTDDANALEICGEPVKVVIGSTNNIKITYPEDLIIAEHLLLRT